MDIKFQDRIDDYLLNRMSDADKENFLQEVELDDKKKEQLEFTKSVKDSVCSREEKLRVLAQLKWRYENDRRGSALHSTGTECLPCRDAAPDMPEKMPMQSKKRILLWVSGIAVACVLGIFAIGPMFMNESSPNFENMPMEQIRDDNGGLESGSSDSTDDTYNDTIKSDIDMDKDIAPDE